MNHGLHTCLPAGRDFKKQITQIIVRVTGYWLLVTLLGCSQNPYHKSTQLIMGTYVEVTSDKKDAAKIVFAEIKRLDSLLNKFNPQSEVSKLNRAGQLRLSPDTLRVIKTAKKFFVQSNAAFDITVAPVVDIWKQAINTHKLPDDEKIILARQLVGSENLIIDEKTSQVKFLKKGMQIDLGGIAKGYAVDCAVKKIKAAGIESCLINAGGNMFAIGKKANSPWKIGIRHPRKPGKIIGFMFLHDQAIATSGDYEQFFEKNQRRFSHIINPKTGFPVENDVVSVTIIAKDATTADALSTAVFVLGKEKGLELSQKFPQTTAVILKKEDLR